MTDNLPDPARRRRDALPPRIEEVIELEMPAEEKRQFENAVEQVSGHKVIMADEVLTDFLEAVKEWREDYADDPDYGYERDKALAAAIDAWMKGERSRW